MNKYKSYLFTFNIIALLSAFLISCKDDTLIKKEEMDTNHWIENTLEGDYLWNDEVKGKSPDYTLDAESFFMSLLSQKDGKFRESINAHQYYSTIEKNSDYKSRAIDAESTYGIEYVLYRISNRPGEYAARVLYVLKDSPAAKADLRRGDWIMQIDGQAITDSNRDKIIKGGEVKFTLDLSRTNPRYEITLSSSIEMKENPLFLDTILVSRGKKIGYLVYNQFNAGANYENNDKDVGYNDQMIDIFKNFISEGVEEFVLDLRYNGGGYISCAQLLGGLIFSESSKEKVFCITQDNRGSNYDYKFATNIHLNVNRLFVLTSDWTASASELIINGLRPYMEVIIIGQKTEGKNVGSDRFKDNRYEWILHPITVKVFNKDMKSDYENGFEPDYELDELSARTNESGQPLIDLLPLGNPNEYMLSKAISIINGVSDRSVESLSISNKESNIQVGEPVYSSLKRKEVNAVLMD